MLKMDFKKLLIFFLGAKIILMSFNGMATEPDKTKSEHCLLFPSLTHIDYGQLSQWHLEDRMSGYQLSPGKRSFTLNINCTFSKSINLHIKNKSSNSDAGYATVNTHMNIQVKNASLDGKNVELSRIDKQGKIIGSPRPSLDLVPGEGFKVLKDGQFHSGKNLVVEIELDPLLFAQEARISERIGIGSNLTFELY